jgi:hypothetical protein
MLLVITLQQDKTLHEVTDLVKQNKEVVRINIDEKPLPPLSYEWDGNSFHHVYKDINLDEITSVWYRIAYLSYLNEKPGSYEMLNRLCREEMVSQLYGLLNNACWVSNPYRIKVAENKQFQLEIAKSLGMNIPLTLVTTSKKEAKRFRQSVGNIVTKPVAKQIVKQDGKVHAFFTTRITSDMEIDFSLLSISPAIFQEEINREFDIRTVVVGNKVFSLAIHQVGKKAGGVDYRIGADRDLEFERYKLPDNLENMCLAFTAVFGLQFSSMDLILGKDGKHYFLENNPCGSWLFVQKHGNYPIAQEIANLLS